MTVGPTARARRARLPQRAARLILGEKRELLDRSLAHRLSLVAFLAWVGLGADGLSSAAYGPDEAFRALVSDGEDHRYLALVVAAAMAGTVFLISYCYSRVIEHFPSGGGYGVAQTLGPRVAVVSGSALLIDYALTIATSVAGGADALFSLAPPGWRPLEVPLELAAIAALVVLNLRGVKESVTALAPIFVAFVVLHALLLGGVLFAHAGQVAAIHEQARAGFGRDVGKLGLLGLAGVIARAYSLGGGTYTGIEAVSNGLSIMREPRVRTAKRTMVYMAVSLALCAGGTLVAYLLVDARPEAGKTLNAVLAESFTRIARGAGVPLGGWFVWAVLASEAALLFMAAQSGFLDGPRVMANMARDAWLPRSFAAVSDRLTMQNGILIMGGAAAAVLVHARGSISALVTMYSINVFLTFSLSELSMCRFWVERRREHPAWRRDLALHATGLVLCVGILVVTLHEKLLDGGWLTLVVTAGLVLVCFGVRAHYDRVGGRIAELDARVPSFRAAPGSLRPVDPAQPTAILLVRSYRCIGVDSMESILQMYPGFYRSFIFVSVAVVDTGALQAPEAIGTLRQKTEASLAGYLGLAAAKGVGARIETALGTEVVEAAEPVLVRLWREHPRAHVFVGRVVFETETWLTRLLHNDTGMALARRLQLRGIPTILVPTRLFDRRRDDPSPRVRGAAL